MKVLSNAVAFCLEETFTVLFASSFVVTLEVVLDLVSVADVVV